MYIEPIKVENKKKKKTNWLLVVTILVALIIVVIISLLAYLKSTRLDVYINGKRVQISPDIFLVDETTNKVYVSIKDVAKYVGYEAHNGEYKVYSEDTTKAYVESEYETASFFLNSTTISKVEPDSNDDYQNYTISEPVKMINNKMYVISDGFAIGFNISFKYNVRSNAVTITTLPALVASYSKKVTAYGYEEMSESFNNQKAILYGLMVCKKSTGKYGVVDLKGNEIISPKYSNIEFIEYTQEFTVTNSQNKVGIIHINGENKIEVAYDEIKILDKDLSLYIVKNDSKYGVIDEKEKFIVHIEYDSIGIDTSKFPSNKITNQYLLFGNVIPVKRNDMWGLFDITGKEILKAEYNGLGCMNAKISGKVVNNLLIIPEYKAIVVNKGNYYGVVDYNGNILIPFGLDTIYSVTNAGEDTYSMVYYEKTYDVIQYLDSIYKKNKKTESTEETSSSESSSSSSNSSASSSASASTSSSTSSSASTSTSTKASVSSTTNSSTTSNTSASSAVNSSTASSSAFTTSSPAQNVSSNATKLSNTQE